MSDFRPVFHVVGWVLIVLAVLMFIPAIVDVAKADMGSARAFLTSALLTGFAGICMALATQGSLGKALDVRQAYLLTVSIWVVVPVFGALPLLAGVPELTLIDAWFQGVSDLTATAATVMSDLDRLPFGISLWRGLMNWIGGLGIAFVAMIFLPLMRVGGMQFFRAEGFHTYGKALPRASDIARHLVFVYIILTLSCIVVFTAIGMPAADAVTFGLSMISTGGALPHDTSFSGYHGASEYFGALFMFLGSLPFIRYVQLVNGHMRPLWEDPQVRAYFRWLMSAVVAMSLWRILAAGAPPETAFRESLFNLTSMMSSTGAWSGEFPEWGGAAFAVAVILGIIGACAGSTAAGISVFRVQIALQLLWQRLKRIGMPSAVDPVKYAGRRVEEDVIDAVIMFITCFIFALGFFTAALTLFGIDLESALFASWASLCNIGYGDGPLVDSGDGTFAAFPQGALLVMMLAMVMGRLGMVAVLVLLIPHFWRR